MKGEEIKRLVAKSENAAVEFKRARGGVPADFWPSYSSFANTDGGVIILGVREKDGERSGMGLSSLYGVWEKEKFAAPSIVESYEPDRTKVMVEFEADDSELGVKTSKVGVIDSEVGEKTAELGEKNQEVGEKNSEVKEKTTLKEGGKSRSEGVNGDFEVLMGAYRNDFRDNARRVFSAITDDPGIDTSRLSQTLGISENSVWRAIRAMKAVGLLVREGGDKGGRWIVKKAKI